MLQIKLRRWYQNRRAQIISPFLTLVYELPYGKYAYLHAVLRWLPAGEG